MAITKVTRNLLSTGIDDQSNATAITIDSSEIVSIGHTSAVNDANAPLQLNAPSGGQKFMMVNADGGYGLMLGYDMANSTARIRNIQNTPLTFETNNTERMRIDSSGNVGIGLTSPAAPLDIKLNTNSTADIFKFQRLDGAVAGVLNYSGTDGAISFGTTTSHDLTFDTANTERVRIDSSGNVGIGTSSPARELDIQAASGWAELALRGASGSAGSLEYYNASTKLAEIYADTSTNIIFRNSTGGTTERMRIDSSGDLFVGKTGFGVTTAGCAIANNGTSQFITSGNDNTPMAIGSANDVSLTLVSFHGASATPGGSISISGGTSVAYNTSSDYRLKENVVEMTGALDRVNQLQPKRFNFIADETNTLVDGFLAHEVQDIVPEAISGEKDGVREEEYEITPAVLDDDGNVVTEAVMGTREVPEYQGIDQSKLVPLLTKAIQELSDKVDNQQTIIDNLTTRIETLENA